MSDGAQSTDGIDLSGDTENIGGREPDGKPAAIGRWTFQTKKVRDALLPHLHGRVLNAFAGKTRLDDYRRGITEVRNDLNPERDAEYHVDAADLGDVFDPQSFDVAVLDPPFSQSQSDEHYDGLHARDMGEVRREVAALVKPGGTMVEFGFNLYDASDYLTHWHREEKRLFRRAIPERPPVFMTACERSQRTLTDGGQVELPANEFVCHPNTRTLHKGTREDGAKCGQPCDGWVEIGAENPMGAVLNHGTPPCSKCFRTGYHDLKRVYLNEHTAVLCEYTTDEVAESSQWSVDTATEHGGGGA